MHFFQNLLPWAMPARPAATKMRFQLRSAVLLTISAAAALISQTAIAQLPPFLVIDDARVFEGNSGSAILSLPVRFVGAQTTTVTGLVSVIPLSGSGFNPATGGTVCGGNVDFRQFANIPFSIPPNSSNGTVNISICGNTAIEPDEQVFVFFSNVSGADCSLEGGCNAVGTIVNDDGPPGINIGDVSASTLFNVPRTVSFPVTLHHPSASPTTVRFATRDGTARARTFNNIGGYIGKSGTLTIQPGTLTTNIPVTILGLGTGTFFMDLSNPVNGVLVDGTAQCTIRIVELAVGSLDVAPDNARVKTGETVNYSVTWTVPEGEVWRDLNTLDLRLRKGNETALLVRWDEPSNTFSLCQQPAKDGHGVASFDDELECTPGALAGSGEVLETPLARLHLNQTSVVGSGPTGQSVTLNLAISFAGAATGNYSLELAATDDFGNRDDFVKASKIHVEKAIRPAAH